MKKLSSLLFLSFLAVSSQAALVPSNELLERQLTGSAWSFPWGGKTKSIELMANGELILGWHRGAKGFKWRVSGERAVKVFVYMDHETFDTMRVAADGRSAALMRGGRQIATIRRQ
jgi:hypothetical protein